MRQGASALPQTGYTLKFLPARSVTVRLDAVGYRRSTKEQKGEKQSEREREKEKEMVAVESVARGRRGRRKIRIYVSRVTSREDKRLDILVSSSAQNEKPAISNRSPETAQPSTNSPL